MSEILNQLTRRLERKRAETPTQGSDAAIPDTASPPEVAPRPKYESDDDIALVFAPDGPVAHLLGSAYSPRRGQARMARIVKQALDSGQHALIEAGTGSGKSFAYLIPLIWTGQRACPEDSPELAEGRSRRAFVSTANKTLQNQLWEKDLPALQRIAPRPFKAALLKGRSNYICLVRLKELRQQLSLPGQEFSIDELMEQLEQTPSGDVEELRLFGYLRDRLTVGHNECLGQHCPHFGHCYYEMARLRAEKADIVVLNHALLAYNLMLDGQIIEPRDAIVIDEAQDFVSYVIGALRLRLAYDQVPAFVNDSIITRNTDEKIRAKGLQANHELFVHLAQTGEDGPRLNLQRLNIQPRWTAPRDLPLARKLAGHVNAIGKQLAKRGALKNMRGGKEEDEARYQTALEWAEQLAEELMALGQPAPDEIVRYCERGTSTSQTTREETRVALCQEPVEVSDFLRQSLWGETKTVICTSATLTTGNTFNHFCRQTGAPREGTLKRVIASPFDYAKQALLYTPPGLYPQYGARENGYVQKLASEVERLVLISRGRAFVLCTSRRRLEQLYEMLEQRLPFTCYRQGMASREELLDSFRASANPVDSGEGNGAVLFATRSFWQGVDIPGEALSLVIIDKLPFAPYKDPVIEHRQKRIQDAGDNPFMAYLLPEAILALKQGVGRLIRAETDRGVMAILDSRVNTKRYGPQVIASLPQAQRTLQFEDVVDFFENED